MKISRQYYSLDGARDFADSVEALRKELVEYASLREIPNPTNPYGKPLSECRAID